MITEVGLNLDGVNLEGHLSREGKPWSWVIFAHGSGSSRKSPRNNWVAKELNQRGFATFLFDLLTPEEDEVYENRFNIPLLAKRLQGATDWLMKSKFYAGEPLAYFGASTGAAAALMAAADSPVYTVISRGGRPDLAGKEILPRIHVPVLLIVGSLDYEVIRLNQEAARSLSEVRLTLVEGATHLFEEQGTLSEVVKRTIQWLESKRPHMPIEETL